MCHVLCLIHCNRYHSKSEPDFPHKCLLSTTTAEQSISGVPLMRTPSGHGLYLAWISRVGSGLPMESRPTEDAVDVGLFAPIQHHLCFSPGCCSLLSLLLTCVAHQQRHEVSKQPFLTLGRDHAITRSDAPTRDPQARFRIFRRYQHANT